MRFTKSSNLSKIFYSKWEAEDSVNPMPLLLLDHVSAVVKRTTPPQKGATMRICKSSSARVLDADFRDISFPSQGCMGRMCVETMPKIGVRMRRGMLQLDIPHDTEV